MDFDFINYFDINDKIYKMAINKQLQGKKNRAAGQRFETKVRKDLESKGWVVSRWGNNVEFWKEEIKGKKELIYDWEENSLPFGKLVPAKSTRFRSNTHGFPDFVAFTKPNQYFLYHRDYYEIDYTKEDFGNKGYSEVIGVESKSNGYLTKEEKEKVKWLLENKVFSKILIAKKGKKRGEIIYNEFI